MANKITDMSKIRKVIKFYSEGKSKLFISSYFRTTKPCNCCLCYKFIFTEFADTGNLNVCTHRNVTLSVPL